MAASKCVTVTNSHQQRKCCAEVLGRFAPTSFSGAAGYIPEEICHLHFLFLCSPEAVFNTLSICRTEGKSSEKLWLWLIIEPQKRIE